MAAEFFAYQAVLACSGRHFRIVNGSAAYLGCSCLRLSKYVRRHCRGTALLAKRVKDSAKACAGDPRQSCGLRHLNMLVPGDIRDDTGAFSL